MLKVIISLLVFVYMILGLLHYSFSEIDGQKVFAKEYEVPMSVLPYISTDMHHFLIPHNTYYITTNMGEDITLATSYFGIVFFDNDNIDKYLGLNSIKEELKSRGFYEWAK